MAYVLSKTSSYQEEIKKSRFEVVAGPVNSPEEALAFFAAHAVPTATHNCWAYRIGQLYRFNDDGEPGGTAGRPILQAIEGQDCDSVAVLVVRWFGGIKLGPGGLIRAYGGTAAQCLRLAEKQIWVPRVSVRCYCGFSDMALVQSRLPAFQAEVASEQFDGQGVIWSLTLPEAQAQAFRLAFVDLTRGQGRFLDDAEVSGGLAD
ncbi:YigZ family protein [Pusillimonas sp. CC-YST705]|uniref:YigZ family protein n=1 Tax=Mesopusillimonas faecipullorum TaxID=2755040 RepID=A0ABS8CB31_9BURK|nr:YigZ family protein [Mesopusillimonas faecipullorum]MCB5363193.1 YigZ family protein [Mesopusillimonas faecipullorum]